MLTLFKLQNILFSYLIEQEAFPKFVVVVDVWIIRLTFRSFDVKVLAQKGFVVSFEFLYTFKYLSFYFGDAIIEFCLILIWCFPFFQYILCHIISFYIIQNYSISLHLYRTLYKNKFDFIRIDDLAGKMITKQKQLLFLFLDFINLLRYYERFSIIITIKLMGSTYHPNLLPTY